MAEFTVELESNSTYLVWQIFNAYDGYAYILRPIGNSSGDGTFQYCRVKLSDYSFEFTDWQEVTAKSCLLRGSWDQARVSNGLAYFSSYDCHSIYIVNLENTVDITQATLPDAYYIWTGGAFTVLKNGGVGFYAYTAAETSGQYKYYLAICYPDGKIVIDGNYASTGSGFSLSGDRGACALITDNLMVYGNLNGGYRGYGHLVDNYLGTIYNLSSPIVKTAASSMKVVYTLTDASE